MGLRLWAAACRVAGSLAIAAFVLTAFTPLPNLVGRRLTVAADVRPAEAIVVLGAGVNPDGSLGDSSLRRTVAGIRLYRAGLAPRLVLLGLGAEVTTRVRLALDLGVERGAILTEEGEPTTRAEAAQMRVVLRERLGLRTVLLVTNALHMRRARILFERAELVVRPAPTDRGLLTARSPEDRLRLARAIAQEIAALAYHELLGHL